MEHCLQTRVVMVEWLKELSLFDHFLHGLFKYLNEHSAKHSTIKGKLAGTVMWVCLFMHEVC